MSADSIALAMMLKNEEKGLVALLDSIEAQSQRPDEVVICDNGSTDGTMQILDEWKDTTDLHVTLIEEPEANIAKGRNIAISATSASIICVADGGCVLDREWVEKISEPLGNGNEPVGIVYGVMIAIGENMIGRQFAALHHIKTHGEDIDDFEHTGGSVAFTRNAWERVGGYPEWLTLAGEDTIFFRNVEKILGSRAAPAAKVYWYHDEDSLYKIFKKHKRNSIGNGEANLWLMRYLCLIAIYMVAIIGLIMSLWFPMLLVLVALYLLIVCFRHTAALIRNKTSPIYVFTIIPVITLVRDLGMITGYLIGFGRRVSKKTGDPARTA